MSNVVVLAIIAAVLAVGPAHAQSAAAISPEFQQTLEEANQALKSGQNRDALKLFARAAKMANDRCSGCYTGMAVAEMRTGFFDAALKHCDEAASVATTNAGRAQAYSFKAEILARFADDPRRLHEAVEAARAAVHEVDSAAAYHFDLGILLLRESQTAEGVAELTRSLDVGGEGAMADTARRVIAKPSLGLHPLAPEFSVTTLGGEKLSLDQLAGHVVVLDFWATWCPPCRESVGELKQLSKKYASRGLVLISVSADQDEKQWREFVAAHKMEWPQYWDGDRRIEGLFGVRTFPTYVVINGDGGVEQRIVGFDPRFTVAGRLKSILEALPELKTVAGAR